MYLVRKCEREDILNVIASFVLIVIVLVGVVYKIATFTAGFMFINGGKNLEKKPTYVITTKISMPTGTMQYLDVKTADGVYTEYPASEDSEEGTTSYMLSDWLTNDNRLYLLNSEYTDGSDGSMWFSYPTEYGEKLSVKKSMYSGVLGKGLMGVKKEEVATINLGLSSSSQVQMYSGTVRAEFVKRLFKLDSYDLYKVLLAEAKSKGDDKVVSYLTESLDDLDTNLTFSDAKINFGIYEGDLVCYSLETGGLGSRLQLVRQVVFGDTELRSLPDFESSSEYIYNRVKGVAEGTLSTVPSIDKADEGSAESEASKDADTTEGAESAEVDSSTAE